MPYHALNTDQLIKSLIQSAKFGVESRKPTNASGLEFYQTEMGRGLYHALSLQAAQESSEDLVKELRSSSNAKEVTLIVYQPGDIETLAGQLSSI